MSKNGVTLETRLGVVHSRSLNMAPFDRPYATFYWSAIVNIALSCTIFEIFDVNNIVTLKSGLGHSMSLKLVPFKGLGTVSYSPSRSVLKMAPFDRSCDFLLVRHCKYSFILYHFRVSLR